MGGRGTSGKTKLFTNIDADRNKPFREARAKELEAERVAAKKTTPTSKSNKKIIEEPGSFVGSFYGKGSYVNGRFVAGAAETKTIESYARTADGAIHATYRGRGQHAISEAKSGMLIHTFENKKDAIGFMKAVTRKDGTISPTMQRVIAGQTSPNSRTALANRALAKLVDRYDSAKARFDAKPTVIKDKYSKYRS